MGTTVAFQWIDDQIWFSMDQSEARVRSIRRDPRVAIVMRGPGTSLTIKGRVVFTDDLEQRRRVYRAAAEKVDLLTNGSIGAKAYAKHLEEKGSVVFEMLPEKWIAYDGSDGSVSTSPPAAMAQSGTG